MMKPSIHTVRIAATILLACVGVQACTTVPSSAIAGSGITSVDVTPSSHGRAYSVRFGKEYESIEAELTWNGDHPSVRVNAQGVMAFTGQATAANAVVALQQILAQRDIVLTQVTIDALIQVLRSTGLP